MLSPDEGSRTREFRDRLAKENIKSKFEAAKRSKGSSSQKGRFLMTPPFNWGWYYCCYEWVWAVDISSSMGPSLGLWKVWAVRWWFAWWMRFFYCQAETTYQFNHECPNSFEYNNLAQPPIQTIFDVFEPNQIHGGTNYGPALLRAIMKMLPPLDHSVMMIFSDGGDNVIDNVEITLYNMLKNSFRTCYGSCIYTICIHVANSPNAWDGNFINTCNQIGALYYSHYDPWQIASYIRWVSTILMLFSWCPC